MSRYIDADMLYEKTAEWETQALHMVDIHSHDEDNAEWKRWSTILTERSAFKFDIADALTADVVEVVRCKDCKHWTNNIGDSNLRDNFCNEAVHGFYYRCSGDDYCSKAERREDE